MIDFRNCDCMDLMAEYDDNHFDLAIVDPPYGIGFGQFNRTNKCSNGERIKANKYKNSDWDENAPKSDYFLELFRVSKNQIVWGGNYFPELWTNGCKCFIYWHKGNPVPNFSDGELAWSSFNKPAKQIDYRYYGNLEGNSSAKDKIHPTQKPIELYRRLLNEFAVEGHKILDTMVGSGSSLIACYQLGFDVVGCELDEEYYKLAQQRIKEETAQLSFL